MPLRIAAVAYTHYESDPRVRREAEALAARGDMVTVWALHKEGTPQVEVIKGVKVRRLTIPRYRGGKASAYLRSYTRFMTLAGLQLARAHTWARFDVVHVHTMPDFMVFTGMFPKLYGTKVLLDMHDMMPELYALKFGLQKGGMVTKALRLAQQSATTFADAVLAVHQNQYELLLRDGVPPRKLGIVMNAADPELFPPRKKEPRLKEGAPVRLVYHGTLLKRYGVDIALRAFAKAKEEQDNLQFTIYGGGDFGPELKALAHELGLKAPDFDMTGEHRPLDEVAQAIRQAHIGIVPGRDDHEDSVLPTKMLEYVSVGIPTIASKTRTVGRFFDDSQSELVPVGDVDAMAQAMVRLSQDKDRRKALVAGGRTWEQEYGWDVQKGLLFQTVDGLCPAQVAADRAERQRKVQGKKTGTRKDDSAAPRNTP